VKAHNSCVNTRAIIDFVKRRHFDPLALLEGLEEELLGITDPIAFLIDHHNWVSSKVCRTMYENARRITNDDQAALKIGFESVTNQNLGYLQQIFIKALASPKLAVERVKLINDKFNRTKELETVELGKKNAIVRLHWHKDLTLSQDFCLMNKGIYAALPLIWGLPAAEVRETQCQFEGAEYCQYEISWVNPTFWQRLRLMRQTRRGILDDTLAELEREKKLLEQKHGEVRALNLHLQHKIDQILSIQQASAAILAELDYQRLFPTVLKLFVQAIGYTRGMIMLIDQEAEVLRFVQGVGVPEDDLEVLKDYEVPLSRRQNILARVAISGQPVISEDVGRLNLNPDNIIIKSYRPSSVVILPLTAQGRIIGLLAADRSTEPGVRPSPDRDYLQVFANQVALAIENARMYRRQRQSFLRTIRSLASALEAKDPYTRGHSERVAIYSIRLAEGLRLPEETCEKIKNACLLHDIGKIGVDRRLLNKPGPLTGKDFEAIRRHPASGHDIIAPLGLSSVEKAVVRNHHERFDGLGYPDGLRGDDIPIEVRVVTLCDAFDAMTSDRPYRGTLGMEKALKQLEENAGRQFDPTLVTMFVGMLHQGRFDDLLARRPQRTTERPKLTVV
jgi:HD-GYP domain-containing protein (c-di-GMP phosphodiesterase class II)